MRIIFILLFITISLYAKDNNILIQHFKNALNNKKFNNSQINKSIDNMTIFLPKNIKEPFNTYINKSYKKLKQEIRDTIQNDCKETGEGYIDYNVSYANQNLISIKKVEGYSFCYAQDVVIPEYINLFFYNKKLYQVKLSNFAKKKIEKVFEKDEDCKADMKHQTMFKELTIKEGKPYIHVYLGMGKMCNQNKKFDVNEKNLEFLIVDKNDYEKISCPKSKKPVSNK